MHRLPGHENQYDPCNLYCAGDVHVDVLYLAPWVIDRAEGNLLGRLAYDAVHEAFNSIPRARRRDPDVVAEAARRAVRAADAPAPAEAGNR